MASRLQCILRQIECQMSIGVVPVMCNSYMYEYVTQQHSQLFDITNLARLEEFE